ncbi:hypothetical protein HYDPIDRAFT_31709 [Hydnomerulius pinastri MD-312]|uniref:Carbohydrate-binding module family 50 protein n=1 Tax=Hydnomerulius pinastri MD-312 TaxID=994086 RepID=A0A0C9V5Y3_9AGAM|nr:hypothetical protein HYDPIDRAFT_31709 [Hydnomerulius pinastri MD-312]
MGRFSQFDEDSYRLPEGVKRIAYDADTQRYSFRDRSGQLYQGAPGEVYGELKPVSAPLAPRRNVTITEHRDPALRKWSKRPAKTFDDILPADYITAAESGIPSSPPNAWHETFLSSDKLVQAAIPKVQGVVDVIRRRSTLRKKGDVRRTGSISDEKSRLLEDEKWEIVQEEDVKESRLGRSKSEARPSRYSRR